MSASDDGGGRVIRITKYVDSTSWSDLSVPDYLSDLRKHSDTLVDFASNPRNFLLGVLVTWFIDQFIAFTADVIELVLSAWEVAASAPASIAEPMISTGDAVGSAILGAISVVSSGLAGFVGGLGIAAPIAGVILVLLMLESIEEFGPPLATTLSDLLGAVPVIGSILDALLTFVIEALARLGGDS